jgi:ferrous iron transport protein B
VSVTRVLVAGNPNVGKTSLFNALTGSRFRVGNYPGVTVESREGQLLASLASPESKPFALVDLPGTYSLTPSSEDEVVAFRSLEEAAASEGHAICLVVDAANLARNLYLYLQLAEFGAPLVVALNMVDVARDAGLRVDAAALEELLGCPVVETIAAFAGPGRPTQFGGSDGDRPRGLVGSPGALVDVRCRGRQWRATGARAGPWCVARGLGLSRRP